MAYPMWKVSQAQIPYVSQHHGSVKLVAQALRIHHVNSVPIRAEFLRKQMSENGSI
jgi:hypothetical protein